MKKAAKIIITLSFCIIICPLFSSAATTYTLLEPLPGGQTTVGEVGISNYIQQGYNYILGLTIILSILMLVVGGVEYTMTFASESKKGDAKNRIENAITGLLIALLSYLILYTINPDLTKMEVPSSTDVASCGTSPGSGGGGGGGGTDTTGHGPLIPIPVGNGGQSSGSPSSGGAGNEQEVRDRLANSGITINHPNPCGPGQTTGCTSMSQLGTSAVIGLEELRQSCPECSIQVTGGTEGGHGTHGPGKNQVDLRKNSTLNDYVLRNSVSASQTSRGTLYTMPNGDRYLDEVSGGTAPHWHVSYTNSGRTQQ